MTRRAYPVIAVVLVTLLVPLHLWQRPDATTSLRPSSCSWFGEYYRRLTDLNEDLTQWRVDRLPNGIGGWVDPETSVVTISTKTPCRLMHDVITHEWAHLLQGAYYGGWNEAYDAVGGAAQLEREADCVSYLLGSRYTPYVALPNGSVTCTSQELFNANALLQGHEDLIHR
jgi:hypothetical protein